VFALTILIEAYVYVSAVLSLVNVKHTKTAQTQNCFVQIIVASRATFFLPNRTFDSTLDLYFQE